MELPSCKKSRTDAAEPNLDNPDTDTLDPTREYERKDIVLPRCKKSNTDIPEPNLDVPTTDTDEPNREK